MNKNLVVACWIGCCNNLVDVFLKVCGEFLAYFGPLVEPWTLGDQLGATLAP